MSEIACPAAMPAVVNRLTVTLPGVSVVTRPVMVASGPSAYAEVDVATTARATATSAMPRPRARAGLVMAEVRPPGEWRADGRLLHPRASRGPVRSAARRDSGRGSALLASLRFQCGGVDGHEFQVSRDRRALARRG